MSDTLSGNSINRLEHLLLDDDWHPTPTFFDVFEDVDDIRDNAATYDNSDPSTPLYNGSFSAQIRTILELNSEYAQTNNPDIAYFLTYKSALPMAQAIRGFYNTLGLKQPEIQTIRSYSRPPEELQDTKVLRALINQETSRLRSTIRHHKPDAAVVVDQFMTSGGTVQAAQEMLKYAGMAYGRIYPLVGHWYHDYYPNNTDFPEAIMDSDPAQDPFAARFYMVGSIAARQSTLLAQV